MEGRIDGEDYDAYDMFLGNFQLQEPNRISLDLEKDSSPRRRAAKLISPTNKAPELYKSPQTAAQQESKSIYGLDDQKPHRKDANYRISEVIVERDDSFLPDDLSLTLSFDDMRIIENTSVKNNQNSSKLTCLLNGQSANHLNKSLFGYDMEDMDFPPPARTLNCINLSTVDLEAQSPVMRRNEFVNLSDGNGCWRDAKLFKPDGYEPESISQCVFSNFSEHQRVPPINTIAMPVNRGINASQSLFSSVHGVQLPNSYEPNFHRTQPGMVWHGEEDERYTPFNQQYLCAQHLPSYSPEVLQLQKSLNLGMRPLNVNKVHPCFQFVIPSQFEQCNQNPCLNKTVRWANGHSHLPCCLRNGCLQLDYQNYRYSPPDGFDSRLALESIQTKYNSVDDVIGRVYLMAKSKHGCRLLQRKFTKSSREDIDKIFMEIICHIVELMTHPFGNYLVQKLLELCNEEQITLILMCITLSTGELFRISCDIHGTRSVQKLIETLKTPEHIYMFLSSLEPDIVSLMKNINGSRVAQRCFQCLSKYSKCLMDAVIFHCIELAKDRQGCCVLQTCLTHSDDEQKKKLMNEISSYSLLLSNDPYGNYVIQFILDLNDQRTTATVLNQLKGHYEHLSMQKFSSNVVEKCLKHVGENNCAQIIEELMISPRLRQILQDKYGNYVMQSALSASKAYGDLHVALVAAIKRHASALRNSPYGKKVLSCTAFSEEITFLSY